MKINLTKKRRQRKQRKLTEIKDLHFRKWKLNHHFILEVTVKYYHIHPNKSNQYWGENQWKFVIMTAHPGKEDKHIINQKRSNNQKDVKRKRERAGQKKRKKKRNSQWESKHKSICETLFSVNSGYLFLQNQTKTKNHLRQMRWQSGIVRK